MVFYKCECAERLGIGASETMNMRGGSQPRERILIVEDEPSVLSLMMQVTGLDRRLRPEKGLFPGQLASFPGNGRELFPIVPG